MGVGKFEVRVSLRGQFVTLLVNRKEDVIIGNSCVAVNADNGDMFIWPLANVSEIVISASDGCEESFPLGLEESE